MLSKSQQHFLYLVQKLGLKVMVCEPKQGTFSPFGKSSDHKIELVKQHNDLIDKIESVRNYSGVSLGGFIHEVLPFDPINNFADFVAVVLNINPEEVTPLIVGACVHQRLQSECLEFLEHHPGVENRISEINARNRILRMEQVKKILKSNKLKPLNKLTLIQELNQLKKEIKCQ